MSIRNRCLGRALGYGSAPGRSRLRGVSWSLHFGPQRAQEALLSVGWLPRYGAAHRGPFLGIPGAHGPYPRTGRPQGPAQALGARRISSPVGCLGPRRPLRGSFWGPPGPQEPLLGWGGYLESRRPPEAPSGAQGALFRPPSVSRSSGVPSAPWGPGSQKPSGLSVARPAEPGGRVTAWRFSAPAWSTARGDNPLDLASTLVDRA